MPVLTKPGGGGCNSLSFTLPTPFLLAVVTAGTSMFYTSYSRHSQKTEKLFASALTPGICALLQKMLTGCPACRLAEIIQTKQAGNFTKFMLSTPTSPLL